MQYRATYLTPCYGIALVTKLLQKLNLASCLVAEKCALAKRYQKCQAHL